MKLYGIFDNVAGTFVDRLLVLPADLAAKRLFLEACKDERSMMAKHPEDYELIRLGEFDMLSGDIVPLKERIMIGELPLLTNG